MSFKVMKSIKQEKKIINLQTTYKFEKNKEKRLQNLRPKRLQSPLG